MDTATVLEIIEMIKTGITNIENGISLECDTPSQAELPDYMYDRGGIDRLEDLQYLLQEYIEGQLNAAENRTEQ
jgi:hypothetical protein